jgi:hypothetical protein
MRQTFRHSRRLVVDCVASEKPQQGFAGKSLRLYVTYPSRYRASQTQKEYAGTMSMCLEIGKDNVTRAWQDSRSQPPGHSEGGLRFLGKRSFLGLLLNRWTF